MGIPFLTPDNVPLDDENVWNSIREDTSMIFQWESESATAYLKQLFSDETISKIRKQNPDFSYIDLFSIGNGAIRPAGESYRDTLAQGIYKDNGNDALNDFLAPTLGYLVYQEQIIEFLHKFCGFTMGEADVVRRHFSKKTGTENDIPVIKDGGYLLDKNENPISDHYIDGFIKTMNKKYGVKKEEAEEIIESFLQVIEDASDYLFSKNHSDPYSIIGYIGGYLRYYHPLEFITEALNIFADKEDKSLSIIAYAKKKGIKISGIKFRHSTADYTCDKETNTIHKGIASIKCLNKAVADGIYKLRNNRYNQFIDLLYDLKTKTTIDKGQLEILIYLDFFSEFGNPNKLMAQCELYEKYNKRSQIKIAELEELGIPLASVLPIAGKRTAKMLFDVNIKKMLGLAAQNIEETPFTLKDKIQAQIEYLGYVDVMDDRYSGLGAVLEVNTKYAPRLKVYSLKNGKVVDCKIDKRTFNRNKLAEGDIVRIIKTQPKPKLKRTENGDFEPIPGTSELWIVNYKQVDYL